MRCCSLAPVYVNLQWSPAWFRNFQKFDVIMLSSKVQLKWSCSWEIRVVLKSCDWISYWYQRYIFKESAVKIISFFIVNLLFTFSSGVICLFWIVIDVRIWCEKSKIIRGLNALTLITGYGCRMKYSIICIGLGFFKSSSSLWFWYSSELLKKSKHFDGTNQWYQTMLRWWRK